MGPRADRGSATFHTGLPGYPGHKGASGARGRECSGSFAGQTWEAASIASAHISLAVAQLHGHSAWQPGSPGDGDREAAGMRKPAGGEGAGHPRRGPSGG